MTVAVIDLGTNTFHLLIARMEGSQLQVILRERRFVQLGKEGVGSFSQNTLNRASECLSFFNEKINAYSDLRLRVLGTAALRSSSNAHLVSEMVQSYFNTDLEIIDGKREAELIYKGVCFDGYPNDEINLIVDIGGGSVEFIIFRRELIFYQSSVNIGIGWMHHQFKHSDPILEHEREELKKHLKQELPELQEALIQYQPKHLIGASGTFDVLFNQLSEKGDKGVFSRPILLNVLQSYIFTTRKDRANDPRIPASRVDYVPLAFTILEYFLEMEQAPEQISYSPYALKEGVLSEMLFA